MKVAIIGGGPIGLAAAAHLASREIDFKLYEAADSIGNNVSSWGHVQLFSPWRYNMDKAAVALLSKGNWKEPVLDELHTGNSFLENYLKPLSKVPAIAENIQLSSKVYSISRKGLDKVKSANREQQLFELRIERNGNIEIEYAHAILDATGTWNQPNPIGSGGLPAVGETVFQDVITNGIPDIKGAAGTQFSGKSIMVVGSGHSAINSLLDFADMQLNDPQLKLHWVHRKKDLAKIYGGKEQDGFEARGSLGLRIQSLVESGELSVHHPFHIEALHETSDGLDIVGTKDGEKETISGIHHIISNTGSRPNLKMLSELRIDLDSSLDSVFDLAPLIDPNVHSCGTVRPHGEKELRHPEKDFYIIGSKSYGRAPTFLLATGYEQVRSIVAYLDGDFEAALRTELELPETGVCSTDFDDGSVCCAPTNDNQAAECC